MFRQNSGKRSDCRPTCTQSATDNPSVYVLTFGQTICRIQHNLRETGDDGKRQHFLIETCPHLTAAEIHRRGCRQYGRAAHTRSTADNRQRAENAFMGILRPYFESLRKLRCRLKHTAAAFA